MVFEEGGLGCFALLALLPFSALFLLFGLGGGGSLTLLLARELLGFGLEGMFGFLVELLKAAVVLENGLDSLEPF